jgi:phosphatidylinositol kinase/protein kinase (PI-3  family)
MFENDFVITKPDLKTYVTRLQRWRDRYEAILDRKAKRQNLENTSHWLVEFQYYKFDEIEVPGQYLQVSRTARPGSWTPLKAYRSSRTRIRRLSASATLSTSTIW